MEKKDILFVGVGEAGGKLLNEILKQDQRYIGLYINSNYDDFAKLPTANENNTYIIAGGRGTGKNRFKSKKLLKDNIHSIVDEILKYRTVKVVHFLFSLGGGTGGGSVPQLIKMLGVMKDQKKWNKIINITYISSAYDESKRYRKNTVECWQELTRVPKNKENETTDNNKILKEENDKKEKPIISYVNSVYALDNNTKDDEDEINRIFARQFNMFMNMYKSDPSIELKGRIDQEEIGNIAISKGATMFYELPSDKHMDVQVAIANATNNTIFATVEEETPMLCEYAVIMSQEGLYKQKDINKYFDANEYLIGGYSRLNKEKKYDNFLVVTGRPLPKESIESIRESIEEEEDKRVVIDNFEDLSIDMSIDTKQPESIQEKTQNEICKSHDILEEAESYDDLLSSDELWDEF